MTEIKTSDFVIARGLAGGHRMTVYTWARPRTFPSLPSPTQRYFDVATDSRVLAHCHWQSVPKCNPTLIALHGLESSTQAHYMKGLADKAYGLGFNVVLLNQRNCGGTEHLSKGLYHSGLSADPAAVIQELIDLDGLQSLNVVGYSLGGNIALKLAGDYALKAPPEVRAVCAVSPTMNLACCVEALEQPKNIIYQWRFVRNLKRRMRRKAKALPRQYNLHSLSSVRSVRDFDEAFTAPHNGFRDADDYYYQASSLRSVNKIKLPTLIISSDDDPFVPSYQFHDSSIIENPFITVTITRGGGHCGFFTDQSEGFDGYWAEREAVNFIKRYA